MNAGGSRAGHVCPQGTFLRRFSAQETRIFLVPMTAPSDGHKNNIAGCSRSSGEWRRWCRFFDRLARKLAVPGTMRRLTNVTRNRDTSTVNAAPHRALM